MAQDKKTPKYDIFHVPDRENAPWYRTGAIWATKNEDIDNIDIEILNPATGETVRLRFMAKRFEPRQD
jgi:hypothetical protein